jgi:hypothetical protein
LTDAYYELADPHDPLGERFSASDHVISTWPPTMQNAAPAVSTAGARPGALLAPRQRRLDDPDHLSLAERVLSAKRPPISRTDCTFGDAAPVTFGRPVSS